MTTNRRQLIADEFMRHWNQQREDGQPASLQQQEVARRLQHLGYPLDLGDEAMRQPGDERGGAVTARGLRFYDYVWAAAAPEVKSRLLAELNPVDNKYHLNDATTQADICRLDWYDEYRLVRLIDSEWADPKLRLYYLLGPADELFRLDGTSPPIHEVNAKAPIKLSEENVLSYLIFFCFFVRGEEGPFYLLESLDDPLVEELKNAPPEDEPMMTTRAVIEGTVRPLMFEGVNENGHYLCEGVIFYSNAIFIANFAVQPTGMVEMLEDQPVAPDLPFRIAAPIS